MRARHAYVVCRNPLNRPTPRLRHPHRSRRPRLGVAGVCAWESAPAWDWAWPPLRRSSFSGTCWCRGRPSTPCRSSTACRPITSPSPAARARWSPSSWLTTVRLPNICSPPGPRLSMPLPPRAVSSRQRSQRISPGTPPRSPPLPTCSCERRSPDTSIAASTLPRTPRSVRSGWSSATTPSIESRSASPRPAERPGHQRQSGHRDALAVGAGQRHQ